MRRGAAGGLAVLPMHDRAELRAETDAFWAALREAIRDRGIDAPEAIDRRTHPRKAWAAPELVLGQTCGLPYVRALRGRVALLGAPAHAVEGCEGGHYVSEIVVGPDSRARSLADLRGAHPAINARDSQSGYAALMHAAAPHAREGAFFGPPVMTGAHAASVEAVATGRADVAAIDAVSFALARRYDAAAKTVRVIARTEPTPGLPFVTGRQRKARAIADAVREAIAALPKATAEALLLVGFVRHADAAYDVIRDRLATAERAHTLPSATG